MKKYKIKKGFIIQKLENKTVIFDTEQSSLFTFNEIASIIFKRLKSQWDKTKIIEDIEKKYKVKKEIIEKDFDNFIKELLEKKIIQEQK